MKLSGGFIDTYMIQYIFYGIPLPYFAFTFFLCMNILQKLVDFIPQRQIIDFEIQIVMKPI